MTRWAVLSVKPVSDPARPVLVSIHRQWSGSPYSLFHWWSDGEGLAWSVTLWGGITHWKPLRAAALKIAHNPPSWTALLYYNTTFGLLAQSCLIYEQLQLNVCSCGVNICLSCPGRRHPESFTSPVHNQELFSMGCVRSDEMKYM